jgi:hypothetical protein
MATVTRVASNKEGNGKGTRGGGGDGGNRPWFMCVFLCVWRDHKIEVGSKKVEVYHYPKPPHLGTVSRDWACRDRIPSNL